jgi:hypothetical protein
MRHWSRVKPRLGGHAGVVKLANTPALGAGARKSLGVQVPPPALRIASSPALVTIRRRGAVAQLAKAPVSKTGDSRFESWLPRSALPLGLLAE